MTVLTGLAISDRHRTGIVKTEMKSAQTRSTRQRELSWRESVEWGRKGFHVCSSVLAVWAYLVDDPLATVGLVLAALLVIAVDLARLSLRRWALWAYRTFPLIFRREERYRLSGASVMMIGAAATSFLFPAGPAAAGILCLAWGDSAAAVVGQAFSRTRRQLGLEEAKGPRAPVVSRRGKKTIAGSLACFIVSALMIILTMGPRPELFLTGGLTAAAMERWTPGRWDNLTIPPVTAGVIQIFLTWVC